MSWWSIVFDYAGLKSTAISLISKFGNTAVFTRQYNAEFDPETGSYFTEYGSISVPFNQIVDQGLITQAADEVIDYGFLVQTPIMTGKAVRMMFRKSEVNGFAVEANDVRLLFQAGLEPPVIDDNCLFDGADYRVMNVLNISPSGTEVYYDIQLRH
jgi:hypothetical protein